MYSKICLKYFEIYLLLNICTDGYHSFHWEEINYVETSLALCSFVYIFFSVISQHHLPTEQSRGANVQSLWEVHD